MAESIPPEGHVLITGLGRPPAQHRVWASDSSRHAPGWLLAEVSLGLKDGRPLGHVRFDHRETGTAVRISVRWDHVYDQLRCQVYEGVCDEAVCRALERDVRHRVGTWMAAYAEIGALVAAKPRSRGDILAAAHLDPEVNVSVD